MPEWGLTEAQIAIEPWGLSAELLQPHKKVTDPVHGDIYLNVLEVAILDTAPMQRLRRVRQLGTTHLVYPGATHSRFAHTLGTLRAAQDLMDIALSQRYRPDHVPDLFGEWEDDQSIEYDLEVAKATVLARLGALLHDLGHVPFGHTLEDDLRILEPHDRNEERYERFWNGIKADLKRRTDIVEDGIVLPEDLASQLKPLIISKPKEPTIAEFLRGDGDFGEQWTDLFNDLERHIDSEKQELVLPLQMAESLQRLHVPNADVDRSLREETYPFVTDIIGNTICADLIDYLQRDHLYTGIPADLGRRFLDGFYVTRTTGSNEPKHMV
ncbi:MAG: HD domain-containing protein, partial [Candidatus Aminicenantes bacterium]|nr:HD domain-containing protein [Candidatus Aminicenantes bacterium]